MSINIKGKTIYICAKVILTLALSITFCILCITNPTEYGETMKTLIAAVVAFYFGSYRKEEELEVRKHE